MTHVCRPAIPGVWVYAAWQDVKAHKQGMADMLKWYSITP
jgi:hypothetical protein